MKTLVILFIYIIYQGREGKPFPTSLNLKINFASLNLQGFQDLPHSLSRDSFYFIIYIVIIIQSYTVYP